MGLAGPYPSRRGPTWNFIATRCAYPVVGCEQYQEALSARLDGEDEPMTPTVLDAHLAGCAVCRDWQRRAMTVTRLARVRPVHHEPIPTSRLLSVFRPRHATRVKLLRVLLGGFGLAQFYLGIGQVSDPSGDHEHSTGSGHLFHESAAWNIAIGAGFAWIAIRRGRPAGALPMLTAFVALLTLLSANDIIAGRVGTGRLLSHAFVLAGYAVVVALSRPGLDPGRPPSGRQGPPWRWQRPAVLDEVPAQPSGPPVLRLIHGTADVERSSRKVA